MANPQAAKSWIDADLLKRMMERMAELKTILFTDIVRSVELKGEMPGTSDAERDLAFIEQVLTPHRQRIERQLASLGGRVVSTAGDGHFLVFSDTISAARWAVELQRSHGEEPIRTPAGGTVTVRMSMHLGIPQIDPQAVDNFIGKPVDYAARLCDYATGEQILVSRSVVAVLEDAGMDGVRFHKHGQRELRGIGRVELFELLYGSGGPRAMRPEPRDSLSREWTVLPPTMGLSEWRDPPYRSVAKPPAGSPRVKSDVVPARVGNYELEERLGSGGMGDVFRARHTQFNRVRAVKVIKQHFVETGHVEVIRRFYQEIKAVGALEHPNIVVAIDSSTPSDDVHYLVMEYIRGVAADALVTQHGPLAIADACEIARQAARGLAYIHENGMVHRDIKPSNLMLTLAREERVAGAAGSAGPLAGAGGMGGTKPQVAAAVEVGVVKILDLGLALLVGEDQQRLTVFDNRAMGTAMYMSPEQWKSSSVDIRADIYSLGCTLYHMLSGRPPFWESDLKPEKAHERESLPPIVREPPVPRELWNIMRRMTAKNPADRYASPADVAAALEPFATGHRLVELIRTTTGASPHSPTQGVAKSETQLANGPNSDTRVRSAGSWRVVQQAFSGVSRQKLSRIGLVGLVLVAMAAIGWLAWQATRRSESAAEALEARQHTLRVASRYAGREILKEIELRFDILGRLSAEDELRQQMVSISQRPSEPLLWKRLEEWLGARKADNDERAASDSWFINDARGVQVARSPRSDASRGENYAHRDYFHGQGKDLPPETKDLKPIGAPHLSAVYRSTSTGHLKVAFSVPIENGRKGKDRQVVGVLAMSVDLGAFNVLEKELPPGQEVVLIDLRETTLDDQLRRGLILHHQHEKQFREGEPPPWISPETLATIDGTLKSAEAASTESASLLPKYRDDALTNNQLYWGAVQLVAGRRSDEPERDIRWLVLVQEPAER
ncbi:MAG: protein kinase [Pirellulales bacterium]|nr:protein kinase [Pirellulales bacterium]